MPNFVAACQSLITEVELGRDSTQLFISSLYQEVERLNTNHLEALTLHNGLRVKLENELHHLRRFDTELKALEVTKRELETKIEEDSLAKTQTNDKLVALDGHVGQLQDQLSQILRDNQWVHDTHQYRAVWLLWNLQLCRDFGAAGGPYDFGQHNMAEVRSRVKSLQGHRETLRKTINFNVMDMLDRVEAKDNSLKQMVSTVQKDRTKIEGTITKLNDYMLEALHKTWSKVNTYHHHHSTRSGTD